MESSEQMQGSELGFRDYIDALDAERKKIQVFQRELPLSFELVTQTIERCRLQILSTVGSGATTTTDYLHGHHQSDSEQTCSRTNNDDDVVRQKRHVAFEEFIPLKSTFCKDDDNDNSNDHEHDHEDLDHLDEDNVTEELAGHESDADKSTGGGKDHRASTKRDWLRSVQLWSDPSDPPLQEELVSEGKRNGGGFQPFQREKSVENKESRGASPASAPAPGSDPAASSSSGGGGKEQKDGQQRKQRRNWSPELHKRFLSALQQLGGSHAATPKQIRELMKVDGLTNDEVKSHLQKYRLHTRRPTQGIQSNGNAQAPQVVFVGGIWVPPSDYAAAVAVASGDPSASGIYAPVATPAPGIRHAAAAASPVRGSHKKKQQSEPPSSHSSDERVSHVSEGGVQHSNSPSTSSSTHTTTTSHAF